MPKIVPTSKKRPIPSVSNEENSKTMDPVSKDQTYEIPYMDWETLIDISEEFSSISLREFIINHIGFKAYINYKLKQKKTLWEVDINMLLSSLTELENIKEKISRDVEKLRFLTNLLTEDQLVEYTGWLNS